MPQAEAWGGFTLIEVVVTTAIISLLVSIIAVGAPVVRTHQRLILAQQQIESMLQDAEQRAFNEDRSADCLARFAVSEPERKRCSDIGLYVKDNDAALFADLDGDGTRSAGDFVVRSETLAQNVKAQGENSFLFLGTPPHVSLIVNRSQSEGTLVLRSEQQQLKLHVGAYGKIDVEK